MVSNATSCSRRVVVVPNHGRLGNQIFQFAVCYALAKQNGLCLKANPTVCSAFSLGDADVQCGASKRAARQVRLKAPESWWGPEDARGARRAIAKNADARADFQCSGHRQNARIFANTSLPLAFAPAIAARAEALRRSAAANATAGAKIVALYHRVATDSEAYRRCLPGARFYARARAAFRAHFHPAPVHFIASRYQFRSRGAVDRLLGRDVATVDDAEPAVVLAALAGADGATFSWGSFSWWVAFWARGPVFYDARLDDPVALDASGCGPLVRSAPSSDAAAFRREHLPAAWAPL